MYYMVLQQTGAGSQWVIKHSKGNLIYFRGTYDQCKDKVDVLNAE